MRQATVLFCSAGGGGCGGALVRRRRDWRSTSRGGDGSTTASAAPRRCFCSPRGLTARPRGRRDSAFSFGDRGGCGRGSATPPSPPAHWLSTRPRPARRSLSSLVAALVAVADADVQRGRGGRSAVPGGCGGAVRPRRASGRGAGRADVPEGGGGRGGGARCRAPSATVMGERARDRRARRGKAGRGEGGRGGLAAAASLALALPWSRGAHGP